MLDARLEEIVDNVRPDPDCSPHDALQALLSELASVDGVHAGVVWLRDERGQLAIFAESGLSGLAPGGQINLGPQHRQWLSAALREGQMVCTPLPDDEQPPHQPCTIALGPIYHGADPVGALELFAATDLSEPDQKRLQTCLSRLCEHASDLLDRESPPHAAQNSDFLAQFDHFTLNLQRSLDPHEVASVAANDARVLLGCDRVSIAVRNGPRTRIQAVSGQDKVNQRANLIRAMETLADRVMSAGEPVTYRGELDGLPRQLSEPLSSFIAESRSRMVMLVPLREAPPLTPARDAATSTAAPQPRPVIGCLIVEQTTETRPRPSVSARLDLAADHIAAALTNARSHSSLFLLPLWRALGRGLDLFRGRRSWIAAGIAAALGLAAVGLIVIPWEYRVEAEGKAMPVLQRDVFAPWDGDVVELFVESGEPVAANQPLARLESDDLHAEYIAARNQAREKRKQRDTLRGQLQTALAQAGQDEQRRIEGDLVQVRIELAAAEEQERIFAERIEKLTVRSPINGVVATSQLQQTLQDRPVRRGEMLLQVMEPTGPWQLELEVPDYRMGHVLDALRASESNSLPVTYIAATAVERNFDGELHLADVATHSDTSEESGTIVEAAARIDADDLPHRHIGADVTAKIHCGKKSLGYVLFGDVIEFLQRHLWW